MDPALLMLLMNMLGGQGQQPQQQPPYGGGTQTSYGGQMGGQGGSFGELLTGMGGMNPYGYGSQLGGSQPISQDFFSQLFGGLQQQPQQSYYGSQYPGQTANMNTYGGAFPPNYGGYQQQQPPAPNFTTAMLQAQAPPTIQQPIDVDPGLWAASGPGGLSTQQGGYSQDPNYWANMDRIASGTQTFTPFTQAATTARAKPLRTGFRGIPVPDENTRGYTTYNSNQPDGGNVSRMFAPNPGAIVGGIPLGAPPSTPMSFPANTTSGSFPVSLGNPADWQSAIQGIMGHINPAAFINEQQSTPRGQLTSYIPPTNYTAPVSSAFGPSSFAEPYRRPTETGLTTRAPFGGPGQVERPFTSPPVLTSPRIQQRVSTTPLRSKPTRRR